MQKVSDKNDYFNADECLETCLDRCLRHFLIGGVDVGVSALVGAGVAELAFEGVEEFTPGVVVVVAEVELVGADGVLLLELDRLCGGR